MSIAPNVLERLKTVRFAAGPALASGGFGERRSNATGAGMEFASYRSYRDGDDSRHIDPHLYARTGEHHVREYFTDRQLSVTVLIDASASMAGDKLDTARDLAELCGFVALSAGDRVQFAASGGEALKLANRYSGKGRLPEMRRWLAAVAAGGGSAFSDGLRLLRNRLHQPGLLVLVSDFWDVDPDRDLAPLGADGHMVLAFQVLGAAEIDPGRLGTGAATLVDAESGELCEMTLEPEALDSYRTELERWCRVLRHGVELGAGRLFRLGPESNLGTLFLHDLRQRGVLT